MMSQDSSDEEDVFSCGRCKEHFSSMERFMEHKQSRMCRKAKQPPVEKQHQTQPPSDEVPSNGSEVQKVQSDSQGTLQEEAPASASPVSSLQSNSPQSPVTRLQDVLATLQGGQHTGQLDFPLGGSESQDGQALLQVFEKLLGSPSSARSGMQTSQGLGSHDGDGNSTENLTGQEKPNSEPYNPPMAVGPGRDKASQLASEAPPQNELVTTTVASSATCSIDELSAQDQRSKSQPESTPEGCPSSLHLQKSSKTTGRKGSGAAQKESPTVSGHPLKMPEALRHTQSVVCKFCSETMKNADSLFGHYMDIHKMKSGAALEFLRQAAVKRKRGRPPKGLTVKKKCRPVSCPHCSSSFTSKTLCATHIMRHHPDTDSTVPSAAKMQDLPSGRRRKCSRCAFQTTTSKDLTAHIHSCHSTNAQFADEALGQRTEERSDSSPRTLSDGKSKTRKESRRKRGRKQTRVVQEEAVNNEQDDVDQDGGGEDGDRDEMEEQEDSSAPQGEEVTCPECNKKMNPRGLKRHQVRCANKNRFVCTLCLHKSRESYDHAVHVDNHRIWVKAQFSWLNNTTGQTAAVTSSAAATTTATTASSVTAVDTPPPLIPMDSNSMTDGDKIAYASTVDLEELALITQIQGENDLLQEQQQFMPSGNAEDTELPDSNVSLLPKDPSGENSKTNKGPSTEQELKSVDGGDKKLNPRDLKCKICYMWFARTSLPKHMLQDHNMVKRFQCRESTCKLVFAKLGDFKAHIATHSKENIFRCGCRSCVNRRLVTPEKMDDIRKEKMRDYYKHMSHKCSKCWVKFPSQGSLDRHMKKESHQHPCPECGKMQVSKRQLRMHMVTHQAERAFLCEVCGQNFKTKRDLNKHTFSHNNVRPYKCPECTKCFSFKNKMTRHVVTVHSAKKPFACDRPGCNKTFSRKDKLNDHAKTHLISFPFNCQYCAKGFYRKDNLKDHEILHTREFRFRCAICSKGFMRPKILERHYLTEHPSAASQVTLQATVTQDGQRDSPSQQINYVLCEPYVYASIDHLAAFQGNVEEADVPLMQGQRATIEALQNAAAAVIGSGQNQFQIDGADPLSVISLGT